MDSVTEKYFQIIDDYFGKACKEITDMGGHSEKNVNLVTSRHYGTSGNNFITAESTLHTLFEELSNLDWKSHDLTIQNTGGLKVSYLGSENGFSNTSGARNFIKKSGLYADTIIINENILLSLFQWETRHISSGGLKTFSAMPTVLGSAFDLLSMKDLFISDNNPPLCSLAPSSLLSAKEESLKTLLAFTDNATIGIASEYFGRNFASINELQRFLSKVSPDLFPKLASNPSLLDTVTNKKIDSDFIKQRLSDMNNISRRPFEATEVYLSILDGCHLSIISELMRNGKYRSCFGTDLLDYWNSLLWIVKHDNNEIMKHLSKNALSKDSGIISALQIEELNWIGDVPLTSIKALREMGEMDDIRELLGKNIKEIQISSDAEFSEIGIRVKYNIEQAMKKHSAQVKDLKGKYRRMIGLDTAEAGTIAVTGTLGFVASPYPPLAMASGLVAGAAFSIKTYREYLSWRDKRSELKVKPAALLFDAYTKTVPKNRKKR